MGTRRCLTGLVLALLLTGCGDRSHSTADGNPTRGTRARSGILGVVHLGPTCPVENQTRPCEDRPARGSTVTIARVYPSGSSAGLRVVARTTTDRAGRYRIELRPGTYVVTADAGMSCTRMTRRVTSGAYAETDVRCDTGIR